MAYLDVNGKSSQTGLSNGGSNGARNITGPVISTGISPTVLVIGALVALFLILRKGR